jgi:hypothetical protein
MPYSPGDIVPESGIYKVIHNPSHAESHEVTCIEGRRFPTCNSCEHPRFVLVRAAKHVKDQRSFRKDH